MKRFKRLIQCHGRTQSARNSLKMSKSDQNPWKNGKSSKIFFFPNFEKIDLHRFFTPWKPVEKRPKSFPVLLASSTAWEDVWPHVNLSYKDYCIHMFKINNEKEKTFGDFLQETFYHEGKLFGCCTEFSTGNEYITCTTCNEFNFHVQCLTDQRKYTNLQMQPFKCPHCIGKERHPKYPTPVSDEFAASLHFK